MCVCVYVIVFVSVYVYFVCVCMCIWSAGVVIVHICSRQERWEGGRVRGGWGAEGSGMCEKIYYHEHLINWDF